MCLGRKNILYKSAHFFSNTLDMTDFFDQPLNKTWI